MPRAGNYLKVPNSLLQSSVTPGRSYAPHLCVPKLTEAPPKENERHLRHKRKLGFKNPLRSPHLYFYSCALDSSPMQGGRPRSFGIGGLLSALQTENCALPGPTSLRQSSRVPPDQPLLPFQVSQPRKLFLLPPAQSSKAPFLDFTCSDGCKFPSSRFSQDHLQTSRVW